MKPTKVLFVLKARGEPYYNLSPDTGAWQNRSYTGLHNSVRYVVQMLHTIGVEADFAVVADNNKIDAAVVQYGPTHVIIEALWVVPTKLAQLKKLHPSIKWNVRLHSEVPFLSMEGIAMEWIFAYLTSGISISANSTRMQDALQSLVIEHITYTPNYYPLSPLQAYTALPADDLIDIGCFGAIRPLKNQLQQAVAAIQFADSINKTVRFHINADRIEGGGAPILKNLQALFANSNHQLVEHGWMDTAAFIALLKTMDLSMQVSFSETFNIVSADSAIVNVPLVVSPEVTWAAKEFQANPTDLPNIVSVMTKAWHGRKIDLQRLNYAGLESYDAASETAWPTALAGMS